MPVLVVCGRNWDVQWLCIYSMAFGSMAFGSVRFVLRCAADKANMKIDEVFTLSSHHFDGGRRISHGQMLTTFRCCFVGNPPAKC
jgi:hypothetical protein